MVILFFSNFMICTTRQIIQIKPNPIQQLISMISMILLIEFELSEMKDVKDINEALKSIAIAFAFKYGFNNLYDPYIEKSGSSSDIEDS